MAFVPAVPGLAPGASMPVTGNQSLMRHKDEDQPLWRSRTIQMAGAARSPAKRLQKSAGGRGRLAVGLGPVRWEAVAAESKGSIRGPVAGDDPRADSEQNPESLLTALNQAAVGESHGIHPHPDAVEGGLGLELPCPAGVPGDDRMQRGDARVIELDIVVEAGQADRHPKVPKWVPLSASGLGRHVLDERCQATRRAAGRIVQADGLRLRAARQRGHRRLPRFEMVATRAEQDCLVGIERDPPDAGEGAVGTAQVMKHPGMLAAEVLADNLRVSGLHGDVMADRDLPFGAADRDPVGPHVDLLPGIEGAIITDQDSRGGPAVGRLIEPLPGELGQGAGFEERSNQWHPLEAVEDRAGIVGNTGCISHGRGPREEVFKPPSGIPPEG